MLLNVTNTNGMLLARTNDATATAETITQNVGDTDFESIRETRALWKLANISDISSTADKFVSTVPINTGDRLFLVKNNGTIVDFRAGAVTKSTTSMIPNMTSLTEPAGTIDFGGAMTAAKALRLLDGNSATAADEVQNGSYISYQFQNNIPHVVKNIYMKGNNQTYFPYEVNIFGSLDGIVWTMLSKNFGFTLTTWSAGTILKIQSPGSYAYYKCVFPNSVYGAIDGFQTISFLTDQGDSLDTTTITQGEIPSKVFKFQDTIAFNGVLAIEKDIYYEYGTSGTKLFVFPIYNDVLLSGRTLTTKVSFSAVGNELSEISGQIYKKLV